MAYKYPVVSQLMDNPLSQAATLTGATALVVGGTAASGQIVLTSAFVKLDPGGAGRTVTLPVATMSIAGLELIIENTADAAEDLAISDGSTIVTISQAETGIVKCDGTDWSNIGLAKAS